MSAEPKVKCSYLYGKHQSIIAYLQYLGSFLASSIVSANSLGSKLYILSNIAAPIDYLIELLHFIGYFKLYGIMITEFHLLPIDIKRTRLWISTKYN